MAWCAAVYCDYTKKKNPEKTFFKVPEEEKLRKAWLAGINRQNLPKNIYLCDGHFAESCFDVSWSMRAKLLSESGPIQRKLIKGSIPTIFPHKVKSVERKTSLVRDEKKKRKEVSYF